MAQNDYDAPAEKVSQEIVSQLQSEIGLSQEDVYSLPERRLAWVLNKLEIPNRPAARLEHEREALCSDYGELPEDGRSRALTQLADIRAKMSSISQEIAGMPAGTTVLPVHAREEAPTAGLPANNTGWTPLGPGNIGGRTRAIVIHPTNTDQIYAAGVAGGVWRSSDGGSSWAPTDDLMANLAVCSLVMDPTDSNTLYAGTGEGFSNIDAVRGDGIFITTDGGNTWTQLTSTRSNSDFFYNNSLAMSSDGTVLLVGTNAGIFRSTDGGGSWTRVHTVATGNLAFDPSDDDKAIGGGLSNGRVYFSTDGGENWSEATRPTTNGGRVQVCYAAGDTNTIYASVQANLSQIWQSTDGGQTYTSRNASAPGGVAANFLGAQGWYNNIIWAGDPTDTDLVIVGGIDLWRSTDGGDNLQTISDWSRDASAHADHHAIVSDPGYDGVNNRRVYFGNDGGVYRTDNATTVGNNATLTSGWVNLNNGYDVTQFYYGAGHIGTNTIMGGTQDNGTLRFTPAEGMDAWNEVWGGDGGDMASDPSDAQVWYGEYVRLQIFRDTSGGTAAIFPDDYICGRFWDSINGRWAWKPAPFTITDAQNSNALFIAPFELDPNEPDRLLAGGDSLWRTNDVKTPNSINPPGGPSWASIKPSVGSLISAIAIADGNSDIVVVGHTNGNVYRSTDATQNNPQWTQIDTNGIGANRQCLALTIDPDDHNNIYAAFGGYQSNNLWRTTNGGQSWSDISSGLPDAPIRDVTLHPQRSSWVYLATEVGVFASEDSGATWSPTNEGPANVPCRDFFWMGCKLICVTHGRGMFEIDLSIANAFPAPVLEFTGTENYTVQGNAFTRYKLTVSNRAAYPDSLFRPSPDLPPCGLNANSSRTWVDIYNGDNNQRIYGFCAFSEAEHLNSLWFALPQGTTPPGSVYIVLRDRRCSATYTSNSVNVDGGNTPPATCTLSRVLVTLKRDGNTIQVTGDSNGCSAGAAVSLEGPQNDPRALRDVGVTDAQGRFNVQHRGPEAVAGAWRAIITNPDGSECCRSDYVNAEVRDERSGSPWG